MNIKNWIADKLFSPKAPASPASPRLLSSEIEALPWQEHESIMPDQINSKTLIRVTGHDGKVFFFTHMPLGTFYERQEPSSAVPDVQNTIRTGIDEHARLVINVYLPGYGPRSMVTTPQPHMKYYVHEVFQDDATQQLRGSYPYFGFPIGGFERNKLLHLEQWRGARLIVRPCVVHRLEAVNVAPPPSQEAVTTLLSHITQRFMQLRTNDFVRRVLEKECTLPPAEDFDEDLTRPPDHTPSLNTDVTRFARALYTLALSAKNNPDAFPFSPEELDEIHRCISNYAGIYFADNDTFLRPYDCIFTLPASKGGARYHLHFEVKGSTGHLFSFRLTRMEERSEDEEDSEILENDEY